MEQEGLSVDEATVKRCASELQRITESDPLILQLSNRVTAEELDYAIYTYVREKVDGRGFVYTDLLRFLVARFLRKRGFTMIEESVCCDMPIFRHQKFKEGDDDEWVMQVLT